MLMIAPLLFKSYALAKQLAIHTSNVKLKEGIDSLEAQIRKAQEISNLLRQEEVFKRLFFLKGPPSSEYYVDFNVLQTKLKSLSLTQDMLSNVYIMFRDNPVFVSNSISSDNYANIYANYYNYKDVTVNEWRDRLFKENFNVNFFTQNQVFSYFYGRNYFDGVTVLINNSYYNSIDQMSVMAIDFDKKDIVNKVLYENQLRDYFAYITDSDGNVILSHNNPGNAARPGLKNADEVTLGSQKYIALTYSSEMLGIHAVVGIPLQAIKTNVNSLLELVILYIVLGTLLTVGLTMLFSMKETMWLKRLIEASSRSSNTIFNISNEYSYINHAITRISTINEEQLSKIDALNDSIKHSVLKNVLILGVYTEREKEEAAAYFGGSFDRFCVAKVSYRLDDSRPVDLSIQQNIVLELEHSFRAIVDADFETLNFHTNETIFVIFLERKNSSYIDSIQIALTELIRMINVNSPIPFTINIGLSPVTFGIQHAKTAYQQAIYALSIHENDVSGGVYVYEPAAESADKLHFDIAILLKLYDALIAGEKNITGQIFADSLRSIANYALSEQEQLQIFYSFRQIVYNAHKVIVNERFDTEARLALSLPEYGQITDVFKLFHELNQVSASLCDVVIGNKRSNNEKLKVDIMNYIQDHYADLNLSAGSIAAQLLISEKYVYSFVKEQSGKSLGKLVEEVRLFHAERLLLETEFANGKIWMLCGFGSENTFYRAFSKKHGVSPTVWRENNKNPTG
ncbi:helix-turn-helix transcriptional regulator [Paenibacillus koleovorans]|uniref:helix-turn-helix transcriptional regulator n=1 Tax=Paenibacillus koleovorans TaxID=121608 RepID=UPI000FDAA05B|nr:helix-turn-helix domain-containing protein [Paenibacillus koleovorans]